MIIGSPECGPFSALQNLNMLTEEGREKVMELRRLGEVHLKFCCRLYRMQMERGLDFLHEHPQSAASWKVDCVRELSQSPVVYMTVAHQCQFGLMTRDKTGEGYAKKPATFMTNSPDMSKVLDRKCDGSHENIPLMEGRAKAAQHYPKK